MLARLLIVGTTLWALVGAHGAITGITGLNGVVGTALGIDATTPRTGAGARPFQRDTSVIRDRDIASGATSPCGKTKQAGAFDMMAMADQVMSNSNGNLPSVAPNAEITMTVHQINQDGAGPYRCDMSMDGQTFMKIEVVQNVPGVLGLSPAMAVDIPMRVRIPKEITGCQGGSNGAMCIIRCRNSAIAGPFGGCMPVMMEGTSAAPTSSPPVVGTLASPAPDTGAA